METKNQILEKINTTYKRIVEEVHKVIVGQDDWIELCNIALFSKGHILIESVPGTGKTLLVRTLAKALGLDFKRIQFTPDLLPPDILGVDFLHKREDGTVDFTFKKGPIFTQFLLADEINRTPPKTQSALLQAMQESEVTVYNSTYTLSDIFFVAATQNPIEQEGTYPLPEAQLDRFLFKLTQKDITEAQEVLMVQQHIRGSLAASYSDIDVQQVASLDKIMEAQKFIANQITVSDKIIEYIVKLVGQTRQNPAIACGASPRATLMLTKAARTLAVLKGRDYVIPDDIKRLYVPCIAHRIILNPMIQMEGVGLDKILLEISEKIPVPR